MLSNECLNRCHWKFNCSLLCGECLPVKNDSIVLTGHLFLLMFMGWSIIIVVTVFFFQVCTDNQHTSNNDILILFYHWHFIWYSQNWNHIMQYKLKYQSVKLRFETTCPNYQMLIIFLNTLHKLPAKITCTKQNPVVTSNRTSANFADWNTVPCVLATSFFLPLFCSHLFY